MDGFRDRLNRGPAERGSYDRYERTSRRSREYAAPAGGASVDEIAQILEDANEKQLDVIQDLFEDAKDDRFESEKQILTALDDVIAAVNAVSVAPSKEEVEEVTVAPVVARDEEEAQTIEEILRTVNSNSDLLAQFAEEQLPMLVRGNSSILNQIRDSLDEKDELLREILRNSERTQDVVTPVNTSAGNEEVLNAANTNNALLNALRSEVAAVQAEIRSTSERISQKADEDNAPLDSEDTFTKAQADEMYKNMEDVVHGECVKVYRNVQKVLEDQNTAVADTVKKGVGGVKGLVIINIVLALLNLIALLVNILGII